MKYSEKKVRTVQFSSRGQFCDIFVSRVGPRGAANCCQLSTHRATEIVQLEEVERGKVHNNLRGGRGEGL